MSFFQARAFFVVGLDCQSDNRYEVHPFCSLFSLPTTLEVCTPHLSNNVGLLGSTFTCQGRVEFLYMYTVG